VYTKEAGNMATAKDAEYKIRQRQFRRLAKAKHKVPEEFLNKPSKFDPYK
jgi:hypothetical protein